MNMKVLGGFLAALLVVLVLPVVVRVATGTMPGMAGGGGGAPVEAPTNLEPPYWNNSNFAGTRWEVRIRNIPVQVQFNAGGQAIAHTDNAMVKMMAGTDTLPGTWNIDGSTLTLTASFQGKDMKTTATISGRQIFSTESGERVEIRQL